MIIDPLRGDLTFADYRTASEALAASLSARGVGIGTVVSWQLPTTPDAAVLVGALAQLGAVQNPLLPIYGARELAFIVRQVRTDLLVVQDHLVSAIETQLSEQLGDDLTGLNISTVEQLRQVDRSPLPLPPHQPAGTECRWVFYTSGTTGDPKGARHSDVSIIAAARGMADRLEIDHNDRSALVFPFSHVGGIVWLAVSVAYGCANVFISPFQQGQSARDLTAAGTTLAGGGTPFLLSYLATRREDKHILAASRAFMAGGAPKPPQLHRELTEAFGIGVVSGYGMTEAPLVTFSSGSDSDAVRSTTEGRATVGASIRIVDADRVCGPGEPGEVRVKGPQVMLGYVDSAADQLVFDDDGWLRTGDLGWLDDEGNLTVTGRIKDIIIRNGENISAKEVEDLIYGHEAVADVAVIGLPDERTGERCCAVVVLAPGAASLNLTELAAHLSGAGLMKQKWPEQLELVTELPRNPSGKVLKTNLRARYG